jgi:hypothetical protein
MGQGLGGCWRQVHDMICLEGKAGCQPNAMGQLDWLGIVKLLVEIHPATASTVDGFGNTLLHMAAHLGHLEVVKSN